MADLRSPRSSGGVLPDADARLLFAEATRSPGVSPDPFPGDTHWYDLPDDDAAPEEDEGGVFGRWFRRRWLR
ncbi:hypothetical protein [Microbispora sp. KK1-11]|uniref:hypothetical protein n=1 Tax=Microbispora sp. KK1-11 TaxID=2053005 RepID=UPI00115B3C41|nr:hypothetical protein [Microbispora sp. KK1-11]TQS28264.1 hypothetical protein FLW16_15515 [Microbispora sp. KK1-11]